jgi:hypothetical protein
LVQNHLGVFIFGEFELIVELIKKAVVANPNQNMLSQRVG